MPCRSDYMEPNAREAESKAVAEHIVYLLTEMGLEADIHETVKKAATNPYGNPDLCDDFTEFLCKFIEDGSVLAIHDIMFNGRKAKSRRLADWWEHHKKLDEEREALEAEVAEREAVIASLTPRQRQLLGV